MVNKDLMKPSNKVNIYFVNHLFCIIIFNCNFGINILIIL